MVSSITHFALLFLTILNAVHSQNWTHYTSLDGNGIYNMYWNPPADERGDSKISFKVELKAKGYFGLGFSRSGGMSGSDIVTGWIKDGEIYFQDRHARGNFLPIVDPQQDYELMAAYENDTFTVFEFSRKLDTCDENDTVINLSTMRVIYAYSEEDPESDDPFYHRQNRGVKSTLFLQSKLNKASDLNLTSLQYWDVRAPEVDISGYDTLYFCKIVKSPQLSEKNHIIYIEPMIQKENLQFVHHIVFHNCLGATEEEFEHLVDDDGYDCYHETMPDQMNICEGTIATWGVGGEGITLPESAGIPLYAEPGRYYMFEVHYDNQHLESGIIDHSGLRFYYTPDLREFEAADYLVGASHLPRVFIPPGQEEYVVVSHSNEECLGSSFPEGGIKVFAIMAHTHLLARGIKARHFRGNEELTPLVDDDSYDFRYQEYRYLAEEITILPGDQITMECFYNSTERNNVTFGGHSTRDEMCLIHFQYYPRIGHYASHSAPTFANINKVLNLNVTSEADIFRELMNYDWESVDISEVENVMRYSEHETQCFFGEFENDKPYIMKSYPKDLIPYERESTCK